VTIAEPVVVSARASLAGVSMRFGATQALDDVSLDLRAGEIHALVGENGAGKSTLVSGGVHQPDTGEMALDGEPVVLSGPAQARQLGLAVVHQEPRLFPDLTVAENVFLGHAPRGALGTIDWGAMRREASAIFAGLGVRMDPGAIVRGLSMADQQLIEIAKALSIEARVLFLVEPTASLSAYEVERLFTIVRQTRDRGVAVLFVSHRLDEVFELCDRATVLRDGKHVVTAATADLTPAQLIRHMVGRAVTLFPKVESPIGEVRCSGRRAVARRGVPRRRLRRGPARFGFAGLVGAGRTGSPASHSVDPRRCGRDDLGGRPCRQPSAALAAESRLPARRSPPDGLIPTPERIEHHTADPCPVSSPPLPSRPRRNDDRRALCRPASHPRHQPTSCERPVRREQQKVVLAKWLASKPSLLILDEPTRGIDIGAKVEVHRIISELAASGIAIILISSDLPEVLAMSDRILVLHEGAVTAEIARADATEEAVMFAATAQSAATGDLAEIPSETAMSDAAVVVWPRPPAPQPRPRRRGARTRAQPAHPGADGRLRGDGPRRSCRHNLTMSGVARRDHRDAAVGGRWSSSPTSTCRSRRSSGWSPSRSPRCCPTT
jgi:rhamnose transport system ATP-binding protein